MTLEIDVDKLKARRGEIEAELSRIDNLLLLATEYCKQSVPAHPTITEVYRQPPASNGKAIIEHVRGFTPGLRRAVILALHTGPATEADVARALAWDIKRTRTVIQSMLKFKICYLSEHGFLKLADEGKKQAEWYLKNPSRLTYQSKFA